GGGPRQVRSIRDFASRRRPGGDVAMNRLYVVESTPTATGARADHRLPLMAAEVELLAWLLAGELDAPPKKPIVEPPPRAEWVRAAAKDLAAHRGSSVIVAGDHQSPAVHALAYVLNVALGNVGKTVMLTDPVAAHPVHIISSLRDLVNDIDAEKVDVLLIL